MGIARVGIFKRYLRNKTKLGIEDRGKECFEQLL
jgi:hypothetical protein